ncbi:hypothetical protein X741_28925 [Mesorhizobium sp. LNHC229A00]|nr:hypothetical protein X741_28925 [Mesorhizobium sp. LNHC229A00]
MTEGKISEVEIDRFVDRRCMLTETTCECVASWREVSPKATFSSAFGNSLAYIDRPAKGAAFIAFGNRGINGQAAGIIDDVHTRTRNMIDRRQRSRLAR